MSHLFLMGDKKFGKVIYLCRSYCGSRRQISTFSRRFIERHGFILFFSRITFLCFLPRAGSSSQMKRTGTIERCDRSFRKEALEVDAAHRATLLQWEYFVCQLPNDRFFFSPHQKHFVIVIQWFVIDEGNVPCPNNPNRRNFCIHNTHSNPYRSLT